MLPAVERCIWRVLFLPRLHPRETHSIFIHSSNPHCCTLLFNCIKNQISEGSEGLFFQRKETRFEETSKCSENVYCNSVCFRNLLAAFLCHLAPRWRQIVL